MSQNTHQDQPGQGGKQIDDNQDEFGRDVNNQENRIGDKATAKPTDDEAEKAERAHEASRKIEMERQHKREEDPEQKVTGGFNQKH
jgi:hypothetical protein